MKKYTSGERQKKYALSNTVWQWQEFKQFATRLGIDVTLPITELTIQISNKDVVIIDQVYLGSDKGGKQWIKKQEK